MLALSSACTNGALRVRSRPPWLQDDFCGMASLDEMRAIGGRGYSGGVTETEYWSSVVLRPAV